MSESRSCFWRTLVGPMNEAQADTIATVGLLLFGLTGFVDIADGLRFGYVKGIALVLGLISLWRILRRRRPNRE